MYPSYWCLRETRAQASESGIGNFELDPTQSKPKLHICTAWLHPPILILTKGTHGEVSMARLGRGCGMHMCEITVWTSKHDMWKKMKRNLYSPSYSILTLLNRLDPKKNIGPDLYQPVIIFNLVWPVKSPGSFENNSDDWAPPLEILVHLIWDGI